MNEDSSYQFNEARSRFISYIQIDEDGRYIMETPAEKMQICSDLYDLFNLAFITFPNARAASCPIHTKNYDYGEWEPIDTTAKFWHMWYFDFRNETYFLSESEWMDVKDYAESVYRNHPNWGPGQHSIEFTFQSDPDLHFTYGTATANFDYQGNCIGFQDTYDMNRMRGQRRDLDELITIFISYIGNTEGGFSVQYGTL